MKVLITGGGTGGHVNPAIAVANIIKDNIKDVEIAFVGTKHGIEHKLVPKEGYPLYYIEILGIKRSLSLSNIKTLYLAYTSVFKCKKLIKEFKPDFVFGTGGYVSWPVIKAASRLKIPTALLNCDVVPGFALKMLEKYTDKIYVNFDETINYLKYPDKAKRVGNPVRGEFLNLDYTQARESLGIDKKFLLSCGGSMGAERINDECIEFMKSYVSKHPEVYHVHATGSLEYEAAKEKFISYGLDGYKNIELVEYIYDMPQKMAAADLVIGRSGANTLSELAVLGKPCVLIPSPNVTNNHQYKNAKVLADKNAAVLLEEKDLSEGVFYETVSKLLENKSQRDEMAKNISDFAVTNAGKIIFNELYTLAKSKKI